MWTIFYLKTNNNMSKFDNLERTFVELNRYKAVNKAASLEELAEVIESFDEKGFIQGRSRRFRTKFMADCCRNFHLKENFPTTLTRNWGIRQQAYMLFIQGKIKKDE